ncbi:hypothetical protein JTB14_031337 [Gonioctena quinquepunctata]|nr:hypothetical protein JTB14_031337 [Gonioctena quinquepunctata]
MDLNALNSISLLETKVPKPVIKLKNLIVGEQYKIYTAKLVQTKFGESVLLELEKNVVFLPQRVTDEYKPHIANFSPEKHAVIFRGTKDVGKPYSAASFVYINCIGINMQLRELCIKIICQDIRAIILFIN